MKSLARSFVYWPNIDDAVEKYVRCCRPCAEAAKSPRQTDLESWPIPSKPWEQVHIDYAGPINGYYYFLVIDAYSKWPEIYRTRSTNTTKTLEMLDEIFFKIRHSKNSGFGYGSQFVSARFKQFCDEAGITHSTIAPYHPQSNGQAERFVDTLKRRLKKLREGGKPETSRHLQTFLSVYRSTPNRSARDYKLVTCRAFSSTPAVNSKQNNQFNQRHGAVKREFSADDLVYAEVHHHNQTSWVPGKVIERKGSVMYAVLLETGRLIRSHTNQLRQRHLESIREATESNLPWTVLLVKFGMQNLCTVYSTVRMKLPIPIPKKLNNRLKCCPNWHNQFNNCLKYCTLPNQHWTKKSRHTDRPPSSERRTATMYPAVTIGSGEFAPQPPTHTSLARGVYPKCGTTLVNGSH
ncbi:uncharacterized protein K02A2.6-like [Wyeomyia smithii]|uniref:uncharacterized protein K02A2.6-like n=1 Tax=Wyeomyia smithii TaxID=174621 RepID=UPI002467AC81|nr:uncharacterized protein K02A2.6-like [Wyeomyia smithii]